MRTSRVQVAVTTWRSFGAFSLLFVLCLLGAPGSRARAQRSHEVKAGQTFAAIARRYQVNVWDLALENGLEPTSKLRVGQALTIPPRGVTFVRPGQTLSHIARAHGCSVDALQRLNGLRGSTRVRAGSRLKLPGFAKERDEEGAIDRDWGEPVNPGFVKLHGRIGDVEVEMVDREGKVRLKGLRALAQSMRRSEDESPQSVHPRLAMLLSKMSDHFGGRAIRIISGFREAGGYTSEGSRHTQGRAADIQVPGVPRRAVWEYCRSLARTGCGLYPHSVFVHVDVREHAVQWVDWSTPGEKSRYGTLDRAYRRRELKQPNRPRVGRRVTRPDDVPLRVEVVNRYNAIVRVADEQAESEGMAVAADGVADPAEPGAL
jgi:uncharacterized protein YcbK (DUF882 family)